MTTVKVHYKMFPQADVIRDWGKLIKMTDEEVATLYAQWIEIDKENKELNTKAFHTRTQVVKESVAYMQSIGIDVHKYKKSGFMPIQNGYSAWFNTNVVTKINEQYPSCMRSMPTAHSDAKEVNGVRLTNNQSPTHLPELHRRLVFQYNQKMGELNKANKHLIKAIEYATQHSIDIEDLSTKEIIGTVEDHAIQAYRDEHLPEGTEIYLKNECHDCSKYTVGEHRCECGNRRIGMTVGGNLIEGYYHYPEAN